MISVDEALVAPYPRRVTSGETLLAGYNDRQKTEGLTGRLEIT